MLLRNAWYVVGWSRDLGERPLPLTVMGEHLVIFRGQAGVHVLEDRCPHRHLPLSMGRVEGDAVRCGYHGMLVGADGRCVSVPSQASAPARARVRAYPAAERHGWVWAWMGDADKADEALIPDFSMMTDPRYRAVGKTNHVAASYQLVVDNLMDLSHAAYVHGTTIGNVEAVKGQLKVRRTERGVNVVRTTASVPVPPTYAKSGVLPAGSLIDRWQVIDYVAPAFVQIHVGGAPVGTGALEGRYDDGLNLWVMNAATPETDTTCHNFWGAVRAHALDSAAADAFFFEQVSEAFEEDKRVLEAQQAVISRRGDSWDNALREDAGSVESRRVLAGMIEEEQAAAVTRAEPVLETA